MITNATDTTNTNTSAVATIDVDVLAKERTEVIARRNALMSQSTANQTDSFKEMLVCFRWDFPTLAETTEIVVKNGGMKQKSETKNTTLLLYIVQLGEVTFNALYDSFKPSAEQVKTNTVKELDIKHAEYALSVYRAMIVVDKHANCVSQTTKFTRTEQHLAAE